MTGPSQGLPLDGTADRGARFHDPAASIGVFAGPSMNHHRIPNDRMRVNVHDAQEVQYWCQELHCSPAELEEAVSAVGVEIDDVRLHLSQGGH